jgi:hypothetical protein
MVWGLGIIFCSFVAIYSYLLFKKSLDIRRSLRSMSRPKRIFRGVILMVVSFGIAALSLSFVPSEYEWTHSPFPKVLAMFGLMLIFVAIQPVGALFLISVVTDPETPSKPDRP